MTLTTTRKTGAGVACIAAAVVAATGCRQAPRGFESPEPGERVHAVTEAARTRDESSIPHLITLLRSDDPLVRMTSIRTLELLTGETLGYDHAGREGDREEAVRRWVEWQESRTRAAGGAGDLRSGDGPVGLPGEAGAGSGVESGGDGEPIRP